MINNELSAKIHFENTKKYSYAKKILESSEQYLSLNRRRQLEERMIWHNNYIKENPDYITNAFKHIETIRKTYL